MRSVGLLGGAAASQSEAYLRRESVLDAGVRGRDEVEVVAKVSELFHRLVREVRALY